MSASACYLIAKYISDLQRMEPRNIGLIVRTDRAVWARFLAEKGAAPGQVDGRSVPPFVTSPAAYKQWVQFWRDQLSENATPNQSPRQWLQNLKQTSKANFLLVEGGLILDPIEPSHLSKVGDDLFHRLVDSNPLEDTKDVLLDQVADAIIKELRLRENRNFHTRYEVSCEVAPNVAERFEFSHAYANGHLKRLYQRVPLARKPAMLRRTVHDSAWMFEKVVQRGIIERRQAVTLVFATEDRKRDPEISRSLGVLSSVSRIANLADQAEALSAFIFE